MKFNMLWIVWVCIVVVSCTEAPKKAQPAKEVEVGLIEQGTGRVVVETFGHVTSSNSAQIIAQVTGQVLAYHFNEGDFVRQGDLLYTIDPTIYQANYDQAVASRENQEAQLDHAKQTVARYEKLVKNDYVAQLEYDKYVTTMKSNEALLKQAQADESAQKTYLDYCFVKAPCSGRTGKRHVDVGNLVTQFQTPMVDIKQMDPVYVDFSLPQKYFNRVLHGQRKNPLQVEVSFSTQDESFKGELIFIDNMVSVGTGEFALRAQFINPQEILWPGAYLKVKLLLEEIPNSVLCPITAVQLGAGNQRYVLVVNERSKVEKRIVNVGVTSGDRYIINEGLSPGEKVITQNVVYVNPGTTVKAKVER